MGSNSTQARGVLVFFLSFVLLAAGLASGRTFVLLAGLVAMGVAAAILLRCKPWEHQEE